MWVLWNEAGLVLPGQTDPVTTFEFDVTEGGGALEFWPTGGRLIDEIVDLNGRTVRLELGSAPILITLER